MFKFGHIMFKCGDMFYVLIVFVYKGTLKVTIVNNTVIITVNYTC